MWTVQINLDKDKSDVGTIQCIWNAGQPDQFMHSQRMRITPDAAKELAVSAADAKDERDAIASKAIGLAPAIEKYLNGTASKDDDAALTSVLEAK